MPTIAFTTLGCRVNQYDTDSMRGLFLAKGFTEAPFDGLADVYVVNTCSVTHVGEKKSRQLLRRAKKNNPAGIVVVTGCYAHLLRRRHRHGRTEEYCVYRGKHAR